MYKLEIYLDNGLNAKYKDLTIDQVIKEIKKYEGIESISINIQLTEEN